MTGVHMLPMFVCGVLVNFIAALIQHKISNKLLMGIGAFAYVVAFMLVALHRNGDSYWAFAFPGLCLLVVGADFQFVVTNVGLSQPLTFNPMLRELDVCYVFDATASPIHRRLAPANTHAVIPSHWYGYCDRHLRCRAAESSYRGILRK